MADARTHDGPVEGGWRAALQLHFAARESSTVLASRSHVGPLLVQRPFYPEGGVCHCYVIHPPGGVVGGDELRIAVRADPGAHALVTTPAAGKFYRSDGRVATQRVDLELREASLEWLPQEAIFYPDARVRTCTRVCLDTTSRFLGWEIACFGLKAQGSTFARGDVLQGIEVYRGGRSQLVDRVRIDGDSGMLDASWGLAGHTVLGTLIAAPFDAEALARLREGLEPAGPGAEPLGMTCVDGLLVVRAVGHHADRMRMRFSRLWCLLRPLLFGRDAVPPRIWAT